MRVRQVDRDDLPAILTIQAKCPEAAAWLGVDYDRLAGDLGGLILVAELETASPPQVLGFAAFRRIVNEAELMNLAVDPAHQHRGVARTLLEAGNRRLIQAGVRRVFLEVRTSNKPALSLYYAAGFAIHSLRKDYYHGPREDAFVLSLNLLRGTRRETPGLFSRSA